MTGIARDPFDELITQPPAPPANPPDHATPPRAARRHVRRTFDLPIDLVEQARDAVWALAGPPHQLTLNRLAADALRRELDRLQREHNDGERFTPRGGALRPGRRLAP